MPEAQRRELYDLRSSLTHGHTLLDLDLPGAFGGLIPKQIEQRHTHELGRNIARVAIIDFGLKTATNQRTKTKAAPVTGTDSLEGLPDGERWWSVPGSNR